MSPVHTHVLRHAAEKLGGRERLRELLRVPMRELEAWMSGAQPVPTYVFLRAVDLLDAGGNDQAPGELEDALHDAVRATGAARGNVQLLRPDGLRIVAQRGFERPFLDFFSCVSNEGACGAALQAGKRVVVTDVAADPIFAGTPAAEVMEQARCRAVQSTPLRDAAGRVLGMLSTHYEHPHRPSAAELRTIDAIARRASARLAS